MQKIKIAVIGVGSISSVHINGYLKNPNVELYAFCDINEETLKTKGEKYGISRLYTDEETMLRELPEIDAVSVCTWNSAHAPCTILALQYGKHVLCEKPMAMNAAEARAMIDASKKYGKKLMIGFVRRFGNDAAITKDFIDAGNLGDVYYAKTTYLRRNGCPGGWFGDKSRSGGGPLIDLGVHRLDLALWLMGYPEPAWVMGSTYAKIGPDRAKQRGLEYTVEDLACAMIKFKNGATLELGVSWASNIKEMELQTTRLVGTKCGLMQKNINEGYTYEVEFFKSENEIPFDIKLHEPTPAMPTSFTMFVDAVLEDKDFLVKPEEAVTVMRLLDAIYESAKTGKPVEM